MFRSISYTMSGTVIAQGLGLLLLPVISRVYAPQEFGEYQMLVSTVLVLLPLASLKMEFAILRIRGDSNLPSLLTLCLVLNLVTTVLIMALLWVFVPVFAPNSVGNLWASWMLPMSLFVAGAYQILVYIPVRNERYLMMSASNVAQTGLFHGGAATIGLLLTMPSAIWLFISDVFSRLIASTMIVRDLVKHHSETMSGVTLDRMKRLLKVYRQYPLYSLPGSFVGALVSSSPVFFLTSNHDVEAAGQFGMAWRVAMMPVAMLIYAVSQVVDADISQRTRSGDASVQATVVKVIAFSVMISIVPLILVYQFAESLTPWILGSDWAQAGRMIAVMTPLLFGSIISGPINMVLIITGRAKLQLVWEICRAVVVLSTFWVCANFSLPAVHSVATFSLAMLAMSILFIILVLLPTLRQLRTVPITK